MTGTRETKPEGYARCGNHARSATPAVYYHASSADVRACYALAAGGRYSQAFLDSLADHVAH